MSQVCVVSLSLFPSISVIFDSQMFGHIFGLTLNYLPSFLQEAKQMTRRMTVVHNRDYNSLGLKLRSS